MFKNFKMTFDYEYIVNKGAVICFATPKSIDPTLAQINAFYTKDRGKKPKNTLAPEFKGVARYKEGDNFDVAGASEIARCKAVRAAFRAYRALAYELYDYMDKKVIDFGNFALSIENKIDKIDNEIKEMT